MNAKNLFFTFGMMIPLFLYGQSSHPWQMFHKDSQHAGYANVIGPQTATLKWKYYLGQSGPYGGNTIIVSNLGVVYVCGPDKITALRNDGVFKWSKSYTVPQGPAISNDGERIYFVAGSNLVAVDTGGTELWTYPADTNCIFGPTVSPDDSTIYFGSWDHNVYAIRTNGTLKWQYLTNGCVAYPSTIAPDGSLIVGGGDAHCGGDSLVYALNTDDGSLKWQYITANNHSGSAAIGNDGLIYVPGFQVLYVLDTTGTLQWSIGDLNNPVAGITSPAIKDSILYIGCYNGVITSINTVTHQVRWTYQTGPDPSQPTFFGVIGFPVVDKLANLFVGAVDYNMYGITKNGDTLWTYLTGGEISEASPALDSDGTLYFTSDDGWIYALQDTVVTIGINEIKEEIQFNLSPNPFSIETKIMANRNLNDATIILYNMLGQEMKIIKNISDQTFTLYRDNLSPGLYFIRIKEGGKIIGTRRVVITDI